MYKQDFFKKKFPFHININISLSKILAKIILKNNRILTALKTYYRAVKIKTVWYWDEQTDQWNRIESS